MLTESNDVRSTTPTWEVQYTQLSYKILNKLKLKHKNREGMINKIKHQKYR